MHNGSADRSLNQNRIILDLTDANVDKIDAYIVDTCPSSHSDTVFELSRQKVENFEDYYGNNIFDEHYAAKTGCAQSPGSIKQIAILPATKS